ncbi:hypothetical protein OHA45_00410 [Streptomyces lydicus]|uniref:hypothetical protein n=1 Tax=Streptomyces lydicus TaxID=47763 RepID=UPI002E33DC20|nr:hypothetical protein [Streptomyces lydicus]
MTDFALLAAACDGGPATGSASWPLPATGGRAPGCASVEAYQASHRPGGPAAGELGAKTRERSGGWIAAAISTRTATGSHQVVLGLPERHGSSTGRIGELRTGPCRDGQGSHRRAAHAWARGWCAQRGAGQAVVRGSRGAAGRTAGDLRRLPGPRQTRIKVMTARPRRPPR